MRTEKFKLDDRAFKEFLYAILHNASFEARRAVPPQYQKILNLEREAKRFIKRATSDEARMLLSYLGVEHFQVFVARDNANFKDLRGILEKLKEGQNVAAIKDMIALKLFVTSDKELITLLGLMSQNIHHKAYTMNLELTTANYHVKNWGKRLEKAPTLEIQENSNALARTLLSSSLTLANTEFLFRIPPENLQVLLYLYPVKHTYVSLAPMINHFIGVYHKRKVISCLKKMIDSKHIQKSATSKEPEYTISALGIRTVNEYMDSVLAGTAFR